MDSGLFLVPFSSLLVRLLFCTAKVKRNVTKEMLRFVYKGSNRLENGWEILQERWGQTLGQVTPKTQAPGREQGACCLLHTAKRPSHVQG